MNMFCEIGRLVKDKTCFVGIGNPLMKDDGVGPYIVDELGKRALSGNIGYINAGDVIENYVFKIAESDCMNVIIVDAVSSGNPGGILFSRVQDIEENSCNFSTHKLGLSLSAKILKQSGKDVYILGIEAADTGFGETMDPGIKTMADKVIEILDECISSNHREPVYGF